MIVFREQTLNNEKVSAEKHKNNKLTVLRLSQTLQPDQSLSCEDTLSLGVWHHPCRCVSRSFFRQINIANKSRPAA